DEIDADRLAGVERREVQFEFECAPASRLDFGRRRRSLNVRRDRALRRMPARDGRARAASRRKEDTKGIHLPGNALRLIDSGHIDKLSGDGAAVALESEFRYPRQLDDRRKSGPAR